MKLRFKHHSLRYVTRFAPQDLYIRPARRSRNPHRCVPIDLIVVTPKLALSLKVIEGEGRRNWFPINPADYRPHAGSITASIKLTFDDNPRRQNEKFDPSLPLHLFMEASEDKRILSFVRSRPIPAR